MITEPGVYDMPEAEYHAHPALSSTGARKLLPPSCPARFLYERDRPVHKDVFDLGTAAHRMVLGVGPEVVGLDAPDWRTKAAKEARDDLRAEGKVALLMADFFRVREMADALKDHPLASAALDPGRGGKPEQSLFMQDDSGVWLRARLDWMPDPHSAVRPVIFDYKTARSAEPGQFARDAATHGYHIQAAWYAHLYYEITGVDAPFVFIVQEKEPPYLVSVCQPDADAMRAGRNTMRAAIAVYAKCTDDDYWPGYGDVDGVTTISLPHWAAAEGNAYA